MRNATFITRTALVAIGMFAMMSASHAAGITYHFSETTAGDPLTTPQATLTLTQVDSAVRFDLNYLQGLNTQSFVNSIDFTGPAGITASQFQFLGGTAYSGFTVNPPGKNAGYDFAFRVSFPLKNNPSSDRFLGGETASWLINNTTLQSFASAASGQGNDVYALLHINAATTTGDSLKLIAPVPEIETWAMMVAGLGLVGWQLRKRRS